MYEQIKVLVKTKLFGEQKRKKKETILTTGSHLSTQNRRLRYVSAKLA